MKSFNIKNVIRLWIFDTKRTRRNIIGWCAAIFGIMFLYMFLFPSVREMAQAEMQAMPQELLSFIGMDSFSDMNNYVVFYGLIINFLLIAISIFAAIRTSVLIAGEEKNHTIEFLNALEISRTEIVISKLINAVLSVLIVNICAVSAAFICGFIGGGETFVISDFIKISLISTITPFVFMAVTMFCIGISEKIAGFGCIAVLICYMTGYLGNILGDKAKWLCYLSPFEALSPKKATALESGTIISVAVYAAVSIILIIAGIILYNKRDLRV